MVMSSATAASMKRDADKFMDLSLVIGRLSAGPGAVQQVGRGHQDYLMPENLDGDNQYSCELWEQSDADKGIKLTRLPYILMLQIKRFEFDRDVEAEVDDKMANLTLTLTLTLSLTLTLKVNDRWPSWKS